MITRTRMAPAVGAALILTLFTPAGAEADQGPTTVATGLDNPHGLAFSADGSLYVAEGGVGGAGPCFPGAQADLECFGTSGAITKISGGSQRRVVTGLPSIAAPDGARAIGPSDVTVVGGVPMFTAGLAVAPAKRDTLPAAGRNIGWLLASVEGRVTRVADIAGHAAKTDPDGGNPNSVTFTENGAAVVDAAGNTLVRVAPRGRVSTVAKFPSQEVDAPPSTGTPPGTKITSQAVPTAVVAGPDGAYYVSQLTGFPFPVGKAGVFRVVPGQEPTVVATGFSTVIDLAFDRDGSLYVLELAHNGMLSGDPSGALIKVKRDGTHQIVTTDLTGPGGLAIRDGAAYVTDCGVCAGTGTVVRIPLP
ncbi:ScyD/ScyE family protein [Streptomyces sp. NBC_01304]|uniref:ScyD/ScyE family protein n=1 Tax=Streptomyces sp. NBC_01304 TaxID=2903818 RepID=UPI002E1152E4|nr:ScyD/ScyE family protein [Streptomyces sp. NBC_01304]